MVGMWMRMKQICTSHSSYPIENVEDSPHPYRVNARIPRQNENEFRKYLWGKQYLLVI